MFPVTCFSSANALEGLEMDEEDGMVVVNYKGLAIVTYRSVVTYESTLFGSSYRGYLILFQFSVLEGPSSSVLQLSAPVSLCNYTPKHMVRFCNKFSLVSFIPLFVQAVAKYDPDENGDKPQDSDIGLMFPEPLVSDCYRRVLPVFVWTELPRKTEKTNYFWSD